MPIVTISHLASVTTEQVEQLVAEATFIVPRALACDEEVFDGIVKPGDVVVRTRPDLHESARLAAVVEVQTRNYPSRVRTSDERADRIRQHLAGSAGVRPLGVWLSLTTGGWAQDE